MYQRNALTLRELQSIQSLSSDHPVQAAETLLNVVIEQPVVEVYLCFLDVLKHTRQHHAYQALVQAGCEGKRGSDQRSQTSTQPSIPLLLLHGPF